MAQPDFTLQGLLADPLTRSLMVADGIDPAAFEALCLSVARSLRKRLARGAAPEPAKRAASLDARRGVLTRWSEGLNPYCSCTA
jgi:hypothetical protein